MKGSSVNLDVLRAFAVLAVFISHLVPAMGAGNPGNLGKFGVVVFFVHTSLVLMYSLERLSKDGFAGARCFGAFEVRRIFRLYPLSVLTVLAIPTFHVPPKPWLIYHWPGWKDFISNIMLAQPLTLSPSVLDVLWSLPLEVEMYFLLPFLFWSVRNRRFSSLALWAVAVGAALLVAPHTARLGVLTYAPCFVAGVVAFDLSKRMHARIPGWLWLPIIVLLTLAYNPLQDNSLSNEYAVRSWCLALVLGLSIPFVREIRFRGLVSISHQIAKYSYGIYLSHPIMFWIVFFKMGHVAAAWRGLIFVTGCAGLPVLAYHVLEEPMIRRGAVLANRFMPKPTCGLLAVRSKLTSWTAGPK
jgi:peptidoglycan/LPS O-acetylase OafA/YrhL